MNELKIILSDKNLIFEVKNNYGTNHFREDFVTENLPETLKNYLKKIYSDNSIILGNDFIKAVKSLVNLPSRVITVKSDCQWRRDNSPLEYIRIESQIKVTSKIDTGRDKGNYDPLRDSHKDEKKPEITFSVLEELKQIVKGNPNDADAYFKLGIAYLSQKNYEDAIDSLREAISINPDKAEYYYNLGCAYNENGSFALAIAEYREAINIDHDCHMAFYGIGNAYVEMGKFHESIPYFHQAIAIKPYFLDAYLKLGKVYNQLEYYSEAIFIFEEVLSFEPTNNEAMINLNISYQIKKRIEATELNNIGIAYAEKGKLDKAIEKFKKALTLNPEDGEIHYNLGLAYQKENLLDEAIIEFKQTIKIDPAIDDVHLSLGDIYKAQSRYAEAITQYEKFLVITAQMDRKQEILNNIASLKSKIKT